jgi:hypothetical protein
MTIGSDIRLVNGVYLAVPVSVTCPVLTDPYSVIAQDGFSVNITERTGKALAYGSAVISYQSPAYNGLTFGSPVTCDGSPHTYVLDVFPQQGYQSPNSPPFKGGKAVASGGFDLLVYDPSCGVYCGTDDNWISFGPQSISIR